MDTGRVCGKARRLWADLKHVVTKAMPDTQQQHGFFFKLNRSESRSLGPGMFFGNSHHKVLVIKRDRIETRRIEGLRQDRDIEFSRAHHLQ